ncbi:MAG: hypothetical protein Q4C73_04095, partial [Eubacteriales bacterium]|nr:hypothetical protein [Eubacteriales bacterium]
AQRHDVSVMLAEFQGRGALWQGIQVHAEKIYRKLTVDLHNKKQVVFDTTKTGIQSIAACFSF